MSSNGPKEMPRVWPMLLAWPARLARLPLLAWPMLLAWLPLAVTGCGSDSSPTDPGNGGAPAFVRSVALSPAGFPATYESLPQFFQEAGGFPDAGVMWSGAWRDDATHGSDAGQIPQAARLIALQAPEHGFTPVAVFGWRGADGPHIRIPGDPVNDWSNESAAALYVQVVADFAAQHAPAFLFLGNESDLHFDLEPEDYARWIEVYETAYEAIKAVSPGTRVGPIFQYERMAGIGVLAGHTSPSWGALTAHDPDFADVVGLTLYPFLAHASPGDVPDDYLQRVAARIGDTPIAITETGWPAERPEGFDPPWETSESHQVEYIATLERITAGRDVPLLTWIWLHPPTAPQAGDAAILEWNIFHSLSLRRASGAPRPVYEAWRTFEPVPALTSDRR